MKVKKQLRQKRIKQFHRLYNHTTSNLDYYYSLIYKEIKNMTENNKTEIKQKVINFILDSLEETKFITERQLKKIFPNSIKIKNIKVQDNLYKQDGLTLADRVDRWFKQTQKKEELSFQMARILDTQTYHIIPIIVKEDFKREKGEKVYVEIISTDECHSGICLDYADGEAHLEDDIELPPYHPSCQCQAIYYETSEVEI